MTSDRWLAVSLDMLTERQRRLHLVIIARWAVVGHGVIAAVTGAISRGMLQPLSEVTPQYIVPMTLLATMIAYNAFCHASYRRLGEIPAFSQAQIILDIIVVTPLLHYTGGIMSDVWVLYALFTIAAALILPRAMDTWLVAGFACAIYISVIGAEYLDILRPVPQLMSYPDASYNLPFVLNRLSWSLTVIILAAFLGTYLMGRVRQRERALEQSAIRDGLTKLYNHTYFFRQLQNELQRAKRYREPVSLLMIDLDHFKLFNDRRGHLEGDMVLRQVADIFRSNVRRSDTEPVYDIDIPCRYGGDEFTIILPETALRAHTAPDMLQSSAAGAAAIAERLRDLVAVRMARHGITASIGVASYPNDGADIAALVRAADAAMYRAKHSGGNRVASSDTTPLAPSATPLRPQ